MNEFIVKVSKDNECETTGKLVRCSECMFARDAQVLKTLICKVHRRYVSEDDYCSWGEDNVYKDREYS